MDIEILSKVIHRKDTAANWESVNPILEGSELGYDTTNRVLKYGDGVTHWNDLPKISTGDNADTVDNKHASDFATASHTHGEATLTWGGKNHSGAYGPIDAAMVPELGANRLAFMPASAITVEYSRDGGTTWFDYEASDGVKTSLFNGNGDSLIIGKRTSTNIDRKLDMLRVTINTQAASVYTTLNKFVIYCSTDGASGCYCTIRGRLESNRTNNIETWAIFAEQIPISGWSGYNVINTAGITTFGNNPPTQYGQVRFIFGCTSLNSQYTGLNIRKIFGFGGVGWITPSNMAKYGRIYSYDRNQNVTFPANISATSFNNYTINKSVPADAQFTDTKVTSVNNHYTPTADNGSQLSVDASSSTAATWNSTSLVTGVNIQRDAKGHVTGLAVDSIRMPQNPNTNNNTAHSHSAGQGLDISGSGGTSGTTTYSHKNIGTAGTYRKVTTDAMGHIISGTQDQYWANIKIADSSSTETEPTFKTVTTTGNVTIGGNLTVSGTTTTVNSTTLEVADNLITVAKNNDAKLTTPAGLVVPKYDGTNAGALVFDGDGYAKVGDVTLNSGNIDVNQSSLQTLATRDDTITNERLVKWDNTGKKLVDSGKSVSDFSTSGHTHDDRYLPLTGGTLSGNLRTSKSIVFTDPNVARIQTENDCLLGRNNSGEMCLSSPNESTNIRGSVIKLNGTNIDDIYSSIGHTHNPDNYFIKGTGTDVNNWVGSEVRITSYYEGLSILFQTNVTATGNVTLNINGLGAIPVYRSNTTRLTTRYGINNIVPLVYSTLNSGCWMVHGDYDVNQVDRIQNGYSILGAPSTGYQFLGTGIDDKVYPLGQGKNGLGTANSTEVGKPFIPISFDIHKEFYYYSGSTVRASGYKFDGTLYTAYRACDTRYTFNTSSSSSNAAYNLLLQKPFYLVGTVSKDGIFTTKEVPTSSDINVRKSNYTQELPDDGQGVEGTAYFYVGYTYDVYRLTLTVNHPCYVYHDGKIIDFEQYRMSLGRNITGNVNIKNKPDNTEGNLTVAGTITAGGGILTGDLTTNSKIILTQPNARIQTDSGDCWLGRVSTGEIAVSSPNEARTNIRGQEIQINGTNINNIFASKDHNHDDVYALKNHTHSYAPIHDHPYAPIHDHPYAPTSHKHDASDINAGILNIGRIPTGTTSTTVALGNHTHSDATTTKSGLMSSTDKTNLNTLVGLIGTDSDNVVNKITEVLNVFENYPEGTKITQALANKSDTNHLHNDDYYTKTLIDEMMPNLAGTTPEKLSFIFDSSTNSFSVEALNTSISGDVVIPSCYKHTNGNWYPVTNIKNTTMDMTTFNIFGAFYGCTNITSVKIPKSITYIPYSAFYNCSNLVSVDIESNSANILNDGYAFCNCSKLINVKLAKGIQILGGSTFSNCSLLKYIEIPDTVTYIGSTCFSSTVISELTLPLSITTLEQGALSGMSFLDTLILKVSSLSLTDTITIPSTIKKIIVPLDRLGYYKTATNWSTFTNKMMSIVDTNYLKNREKLIGTTPEKLNFIFNNSSSNPGFSVEASQDGLCTGEVVIPSHWEHTNGNWYPVIAIPQLGFLTTGAVLAPITSIIIPDTVTNIGSGAFKYGSSLKSVTIKGNALTLAEGAFGTSGLKELIIPDHTSMEIVMSPSSLDKFEKIYVNPSRVSDYKLKWSSLANKVFPIPETKYGNGAGGEVDLQILWEE